MDLLAIIDDLRHRVNRLEEDNTSVHDRLGKIEDKCSAAWKSINEQKTEVRELREEMKELRNDIKELKLANRQSSKDLKWIKWVVVVSAVISLLFFIYIWRHDADLAKAILTIGSTVATAI